MENNERPLTRLLLLIAISVLTVHCESRNPNAKVHTMTNRAEVLWANITSHRGLDDDSIRACQLEAGCIDKVVSFWNHASIPQRADAADYIAELGGQWVEPRGEVSGYFGRYLVDDSIVGALVAAVATTTHNELLNAVTKILVESTPDSLIRNHASELESALAKHPELLNKGMLIGKLGNRRGLKIIQNWKSYLENNPDESNAVLGKLGNAEGERKVIEAYLAEKDGTRKEAFAQLLGYMATPKALNTLAIDLRTPFTYAWNQRAQRSFRLHVIDALSRAYPFEPLLWRTIYRPTGDAYYEEIEQWAEKTIGVKFTRPRPPFLYQEDAPMMRPR